MKYGSLSHWVTGAEIMNPPREQILLLLSPELGLNGPGFVLNWSWWADNCPSLTSCAITTFNFWDESCCLAVTLGWFCTHDLSRSFMVQSRNYCTSNPTNLAKKANAKHICLTALNQIIKRWIKHCHLKPTTSVGSYNNPSARFPQIWIWRQKK